jgi:hypothetical protein
VKGEKLQTTHKYKHRLRVTFCRSFPIDMLRYDRCSPATETSANKIENSIHEYGANVIRPLVVYVEKMHSGSNPQRERGIWTIDRWRAYGCEVEYVDAWHTEDHDDEIEKRLAAKQRREG